MRCDELEMSLEPKDFIKKKLRVKKEEKDRSGIVFQLYNH